MNVLARIRTGRDAAWRKSLRLSNAERYWIYFALTGLISLVLILISYSALEGKMYSGSIASDLRCLLEDLEQKVAIGTGCVPSKPATAIAARETVASPTVSISILQIAGVICISFLWFYTFILKQKRYIACSVLVTCAYVIGMFDVDQPAVLVAALVAIFVAAEHFGKLTEQEMLLAEQGNQLSKSREALNETDLKLRSVVKKVLRISNSTQLSLNRTGVEIFMQDVYGAYSRAQTIYAVERSHRIEKDWWSHAETAFANGADLASVWQWYEAVKPVPLKKEGRLTLYLALTQARDGASTLTGAAGAESADGVRSAHFVSYMAMPETSEWRQRNPEDLFEELLGLAWQCLVLDRVRKHLRRKGSIGVWISKPLCWAYATDKEVWQVIKRNKLEESTVIKTADLVIASDSQLDVGLSANIIESTQAEIRRYLRRGVRAEEYLSAVLCYARIEDADAVLHGPGSEIVYYNIYNCLCKLNMKQWIRSKAAEIDNRKSLTDERGGVTEKICVSIFKEFIEMCWSNPVAGRGIAFDRLNTSLFLAQEVL